MRVSVNRDACVGHGKCYLVAPDLFAPIDADEIGRACALVEEVDPSDSALVGRLKICAANCPEDAIQLD